MKQLKFYEKPGCKGNARQKAMLVEKGFELEVVSIFDQPWDERSLRPFFGEREVSQWFNITAPAIKQGEISIAGLDEKNALALLVKDPILIRRPLIDYDGRKSCGFDDFVVKEILGLAADAGDLEQCQNISNGSRCE